MNHVTVSNGHQFYRIDANDLADAIADGFYRPAEKGQTIVGDDRFVFEVPIAEAEAAAKEGLCDLLADERQAWVDRPHETGPGANGQSGPGANGQSGNADSVPFAEATVLLEGLTEAEREAEQQRLAAEQELAETSGWRWLVLWIRLGWARRRVSMISQLRGSGLSLAVHVALLLILASLFLKVDEEPKGLVLDASPAVDNLVEEVVIEATPLEITEPSEDAEPEAPAETEVVKAEVAAIPDFAGAIRGDAIKPPAKPSDGGTGTARSMKKASFFGKRVAAVEYVFVIDNSNSMTRGRFETALNELLIAVNQLTPRQRFYVLFYSDTAYPMFHPTPANQLIPATPRNKELLRNWLGTVQLCLQTNGKEAIQAAFALQPDVIFVLGDGAFTDKAAQFFASRPQSRIPVHALGMEVKPKDAEAFALLAKANGGTYKDVGVAPGAAELAKRQPRPRNSSRGPIWGLTLKPKK